MGWRGGPFLTEELTESSRPSVCVESDAIGGRGCASVTAENGPLRPEQAALAVRFCLGWVGVCLT